MYFFSFNLVNIFLVSFKHVAALLLRSEIYSYSCAMAWNS